MLPRDTLQERPPQLERSGIEEYRWRATLFRNVLAQTDEYLTYELTQVDESGLAISSVGTGADP